MREKINPQESLDCDRSIALREIRGYRNDHSLRREGRCLITQQGIKDLSNIGVPRPL